MISGLVTAHVHSNIDIDIDTPCMILMFFHSFYFHLILQDSLEYQPKSEETFCGKITAKQIFILR